MATGMSLTLKSRLAQSSNHDCDSEIARHSVMPLDQSQVIVQLVLGRPAGQSMQVFLREDSMQHTAAADL